MRSRIIVIVVFVSLVLLFYTAIYGIEIGNFQILSISKLIYETKQYDIGYLWRVLGNYAQKRNVNLGIDVQKNTSANSTYNINFKVAGKYVNISQFIIDIENNSDLYFRIYNFKMSGDSETVTATFTVRNVNIDPTTIAQGTTNTQKGF